MIPARLLLPTMSARRATDDPRGTPDGVYGHKDGLALIYDVRRLAWQSRWFVRVRTRTGRHGEKQR